MKREWRQAEITEGPRKGEQIRVRRAYVRDVYSIEFADGATALVQGGGWFRFINWHSLIDTTITA